MSEATYVRKFSIDTVRVECERTKCPAVIKFAFDGSATVACQIAGNIDLCTLNRMSSAPNGGER